MQGEAFGSIGKLEVCRDTKTDESFMINTVNGVVQRLTYDPETMLISSEELTETEIGRLEYYGFDPVVVTKADWQTIEVYEDCRSLFFPAYQHNDYTNGTPPMNETVEYKEPTAVPWTVIVGASAVIAVAIVIATVAFVKSRRIKAPR